MKKTLPLSLLLAAALSSTAFASKEPRGTKFDATVEDGTPRVLHSKAHADGESAGQEEEFLGETEETVAPPVEKRVEKRLAARSRPRPGRPKTFTKTITITESTEGGDTIESQGVDEVTLQPAHSDAQNAELIARIQKLEEMIAAQNAKAAQEPTALANEEQEEEKPVIPAAEQKNTRTAGEKIPSGKEADIAERLKYANLIVKKFGIAYDYRAMTVSDFKRVYAKLQAKKAAQSKETAEN